VKITVTNIAGKLFTQFRSRADTTIECPDRLSPGVYVVTAVDDDRHSVAEKVIVQ
jgi:hypothetical protein